MVRDMSDIKEGDTVRLKSGGPLMTVNHLRDIEGTLYAHCTWFVGKEQKSGDFPTTSIEKSKKTSGVVVGRTTRR